MSDLPEVSVGARRRFGAPGEGSRVGWWLAWPPGGGAFDQPKTHSCRMVLPITIPRTCLRCAPLPVGFSGFYALREGFAAGDVRQASTQKQRIFTARQGKDQHGLDTERQHIRPGHGSAHICRARLCPCPPALPLRFFSTRMIARARPWPRPWVWVPGMAGVVVVCAGASRW